MSWIEIIGAIALILAFGLAVALVTGIVSAADLFYFSKSIVEAITAFSPELEINDLNSLIVFLLALCIFYALLFFAVKHEKLVTFISLLISCLILWKVKIFGIPAGFFAVLSLLIWVRGNIS